MSRVRVRQRVGWHVREMGRGVCRGLVAVWNLMRDNAVMTVLLLWWLVALVVWR